MCFESELKRFQRLKQESGVSKEQINAMLESPKIKALPKIKSEALSPTLGGGGINFFLLDFFESPLSPMYIKAIPFSFNGD